MENIQLIFLDIDGVLRTAQSEIYWNRKLGKSELSDPESPCITSYLCPSACSNLEWLLEQVPNARIVISSTWRKYAPLARIQSILERNGVSPDRVIGRTRELDGNRGDEIFDYLHTHYGQEEATPNLIIIDDGTDMGTYRPRLVRTHTYDGLTLLQAFQGAQMLGVKELPVYAL